MNKSPSWHSLLHFHCVRALVKLKISQPRSVSTVKRYAFLSIPASFYNELNSRSLTRREYITEMIFPYNLKGFASSESGKEFFIFAFRNKHAVI